MVVGMTVGEFMALLSESTTGFEGFFAVGLSAANVVDGAFDCSVGAFEDFACFFASVGDDFATMLT